MTKNISCLFKTAQLEIQRKNNEIEELRKQVSNLPQQRRPQHNQQRGYNNNRGDNNRGGDNRHNKDQKNQQQSRPNPDRDRDREKSQRDDRKASNTHHNDKDAREGNKDVLIDRRARSSTSGSTDNKNSRSSADKDSKAVDVK